MTTKERHIQKPTDRSSSMSASTKDGIDGSKSNHNNNNNTGRPPTTSFLRSAVYYQNRIIVQDRKRSPTQTSAGQPNGTYSLSRNSANTAAEANRAQQISNSAINRPEEACEHTTTEVKSIHGNYLSDADDAMDAAGIDIVVTDTENNEHKVKKKSIFKRCLMCLQDNRMKGNPDAEEILANSSPEEYRILKKILNTTFLSIGVALLIAVVIVIIYSAIGRYIGKFNI